jgi:hypothetical protein
MASKVTDFLWGSTPTITTPMLLPPHPRATPVGEGGQSYFESGNPLLDHDLTSGTRQERSPIKSHNHRLGRRHRERPAEHLDNSLAGPQS